MLTIVVDSVAQDDHFQGRGNVLCHTIDHTSAKCRKQYVQYLVPRNEVQFSTLSLMAGARWISFGSLSWMRLSATPFYSPVFSSFYFTSFKVYLHFGIYEVDSMR